MSVSEVFRWIVAIRAMMSVPLQRLGPVVQGMLIQPVEDRVNPVHRSGSVVGLDQPRGYGGHFVLAVKATIG